MGRLMGYLGLFVLLVGNAVAQCATCHLQRLGVSGADAGSAWLIIWGVGNSGDCKHNPFPHCLAHASCLVSAEISILDTSGASYSSRLRLGFVDHLGQPVGGTLVGDLIPLTDTVGPLQIKDFAMACGQKFGIDFHRNLDVQPFLSVSAACSGCPPEGQ